MCEYDADRNVSWTYCMLYMASVVTPSEMRPLPAELNVPADAAVATA